MRYFTHKDRTNLTIAVGLVTAALIVAVPAKMFADASPVSPTLADQAIVLEPCVTEDSDNCYWDATLHGNGEGRSFISLNGMVYFAEEH